MLNTVLRPTMSACAKSFRTSDSEPQSAPLVIRYQFIKGTSASRYFSENLRMAGLLITRTKYKFTKCKPKRQGVLDYIFQRVLRRREGSHTARMTQPRLDDDAQDSENISNAI